MASKWFVFWMCLFVVSLIKGGPWPLFLLLAYLCDDPQADMQSKMYLDTKRLIQQYFEHYFGKRGV